MLHCEYKRGAAERGTTFSKEVERALRVELLRDRREAHRPFRLITAGAGCRPIAGVDYTSNAALLDLVDAGDPQLA